VNVINKGRENTRGKNRGRMHENGPKQKKAWLVNHLNTCFQENGQRKNLLEKVLAEERNY
jgi:hypothetical protein